MKAARFFFLLLAFLLLLTACSGPTRPSLVETERQPMRTVSPAETAAVSAPSETTRPAEEETERLLRGKADGYAGLIEVLVRLRGEDILAIDVDHQEPEGIGGRAIDRLVSDMVARDSTTDIDIPAGATVTGQALVAAVLNALQPLEHPYVIAREELPGALPVQTVAELTLGLGFTSAPAPADAEPAVQLAVVAALFDQQGQLVDLLLDGFVWTPENFAGWPVLEAQEEAFLAEIDEWRSKRAQGVDYRLAYGSFAEESRVLENWLRGRTLEEIADLVDRLFASRNGGPLQADSEVDEDRALYEALSQEDKELLGPLQGKSSLSLMGEEGDFLTALQEAFANRRPLAAGSLARFGLGFASAGRLGPGTDTLGLPVYSLNLDLAAVLYDADDRLFDLLLDTLEIQSPNGQLEGVSRFSGWPGVFAVYEAFQEDVLTFQTKRERGQELLLDSGSWADQLDLLQAFLSGQNDEERREWAGRALSDLDGRLLREGLSEPEDSRKFAALSQAEKDEIADLLATVTVSLRGLYGSPLAALEDAGRRTVDVNIQNSVSAGQEQQDEETP